jgi:hypothetical protein
VVEAKNGHGGRALDGLLFLVWLEDVARDVPNCSGPVPDLEPADQRALDALGPDLVLKILEEDVT